MLNDHLHIMTDVEEFDRLQKSLAHISNRSARVHQLERIMRLYKGAMCPNYCTEQWAIGRFAQYEADFTTGVMCFWPILAIRLDQNREE